MTYQMTRAEMDRALLERVLEDEEKLSETEADAFAHMAEILERSDVAVLTHKQRVWAEDVGRRLDGESAPPLPVENLFSSGKVPDPGARFDPLDNLPKPLRPPGRP